MPRRINLLLRVAVLAVAPALGTAVALGQSLDRVRLTDKTDIIGEIVAVNPSDVEIKDQLDGVAKKVAIDRIAFVAFGDEPDALRSARTMLLRQNAAAALEELGKIQDVELKGASNNVLADVAYLNAAAAGKLAAVSGSGVKEAEAALRAFMQKFPRSHNLFRAYELLGDMLVRAGRFDDAAAAYGALEKGPPGLRVRAAMGKAGSYYEQKNFAAAEREYAAAVKTCDETQAKAESQREDAKKKRAEAEKSRAKREELVELRLKEAEAQRDREGAMRQKREAQIGLSRCLARLGKAPEAVKAAQDVISGAAPDDRELLGRAYAALGDAQSAAGKDQDALIAFLMVDLVYNTLPENHAEALYNLAQLWQKVKNPERSRGAQQALETSYPESRWTKALAGTDAKG